MIKNGNLVTAIIKPDYVLTPEGLKKGWSIRIEEGRITCVGPWDTLGNGSNEKMRTVCLPGQMPLPGFVSEHNHVYGALSRDITAEAMVADFSDYLEDFWWSYVEDRVDHDLVRATTRWACVEMINSGVTSFVDILEGPNSIPGALAVEEEEVEKAGLQGFLSFETYEGKSGESGRLGLEGNFGSARACNEESDLAKGIMSIRTLFTCGEDFIREAKRTTDEAGCLFHMHMSGSDPEPAWAREHLRATPVGAYGGMGRLDESVLAPRLVQVTSKEIAILAEKDVNAISIPLSNYEVSGGVTPMKEMLGAGMTIGLDTGGYMNDFFEIMRGALLVHKGYHKDPQAMPTRRVYRIAAGLGAKAVGIEAGVIEESILADLITVDVARPTPINEYDVYDQLVLFTDPQNVINVMMGGAWLKKDGELMTLDREAVRGEMEEKTERSWKGDSECC